MISSGKRSLWSVVATATLSTMLCGPAAAAGPVTVTVNGSAANLSPAPVTRAGRVFVPLRGVFERLGATVVYDAGTINATGRGHSISLKIGSQQATVDGQTQTVDVAPFIIGASTYVPLRFVSQALGATVNYDGANNLVAISTSGGSQNPPKEVITPVPGTRYGSGAITLTSVNPPRGSLSNELRPTIQATFSGRVDPSSLRIMLDGADVTAAATRLPTGFTYTPSVPLGIGGHRVRVTGTDRAGNPFDRSWAFSHAG
jgi:hypothetical protein